MPRALITGGLQRVKISEHPRCKPELPKLSYHSPPEHRKNCFLFIPKESSAIKPFCAPFPNHPGAAASSVERVGDGWDKKYLGYHLLKVTPLGTVCDAQGQGSGRGTGWSSSLQSLQGSQHREWPTRERMCALPWPTPAVPSCPQGWTPSQDSNVNLSSTCTYDPEQVKAAVGFLNEQDDEDGNICP